MKPIQSLDYTIFFEDALSELQAFIKSGSYSKVFALVDTHTEQHCLPILQDTLSGIVNFDVIEIDAGEESKNIDYCIGVWKTLLDFEADRNSLLINLGGGVVTDMGSFAAATYKRGIDFIQVPTTLLAQVDASVGGKTGIDLDQVKNLIGTFTQPKAVFIIPEFLQTLDQRQMLSGFAEMIKHGLIYDVAFFNKLRQIKPEQVSAEMIYRSIAIKNEVVSQDPLEKGLRKVLNFGHTIGHAIESFSLSVESTPLLHGEAIAIGFICEAYLSTKKSGLSPAEFAEIEKYILSLYPAHSIQQESFPTLIEIMKNDKKNTAAGINFSLLNQIGKSSFDYVCTADEIMDSLDYYLKITKLKNI